MKSPVTSESEICWQRWALSESGAKGWLRAGLVALLVAGLELVLLFSLPPFAALVMGIAFIGLLLPYYLPAVYRIGSEGVRVQRGIFATRLQAWSTFATTRQTEQGCWLIPVNRNSVNKQSAPLPMFEPLRAVFLPYPIEPELKASLLVGLKHYLPPD